MASEEDSLFQNQRRASWVCTIQYLASKVDHNFINVIHIFCYEWTYAIIHVRFKNVHFNSLWDRSRNFSLILPRKTYFALFVLSFLTAF